MLLAVDFVTFDVIFACDLFQNNTKSISLQLEYIHENGALSVLFFQLQLELIFHNYCGQ